MTLVNNYPINSSLEDASLFVSKLNAFISASRLEGLLKIDHIGFNCEDQESFDRQRQYWESRSLYMFQNFTSRRSLKVRLRDSLQTLAGDLKFLEISDYKGGIDRYGCFDHVEFVVDTEKMPNLLKDLNKSGIYPKYTVVKRPGVTDHCSYDFVFEEILFKIVDEFLIDKIKRLEMV